MNFLFRYQFDGTFDARRSMLSDSDLPEAALAEHPSDTVPVFDIVYLLQPLEILEIEDVAIFLLHSENTVLGRAAGIVVAHDCTTMHQFRVSAQELFVVLQRLSHGPALGLSIVPVTPLLLI